VEKYDSEHSPAVEPTERTPPPDDDTSLDVVKPNSDQNEDASLEDIEAKVVSLTGLSVIIVIY